MSIKPKSTIKRGFYKKYVDDIKEEKQQKDKEDKVIVINQNEKENLLSTIFRGIGSVFRVIVYILLFALSSIGLTAIVNEPIRDILLKLIKIS
jgi:hypothetical protein